MSLVLSFGAVSEATADMVMNAAKVRVATVGAMLILAYATVEAGPDAPDFDANVQHFKLFIQLNPTKAFPVATGLKSISKRLPNRKCSAQALADAIGIPIKLSDEGDTVFVDHKTYTLHYTKRGDVYYHYGARDNRDKIVTDGLKWGSYVTNIDNLTRSEAVAGLALYRSVAPNPNAVYTVLPRTCTPIAWDDLDRRAISQGPAFPGGLDEYVFPEGTGSRTVLEPRSIGP